MSDSRLYPWQAAPHRWRHTFSKNSLVAGESANCEYAVGTPQIGYHRALLRAVRARKTGRDRLPSA